jgi:hypothetical protein
LSRVDSPLSQFVGLTVIDPGGAFKENAALRGGRRGLTLGGAVDHSRAAARSPTAAVCPVRTEDLTMHRRMFFGVFGLLALASVVAVLPAQDGRNSNRSPNSKWAILIGVENYANVTKLDCSGKDMDALRDRLVATGFPANHIFVLTDNAKDNRFLPFKANIEKQLDLVLGEINDKTKLVKAGMADKDDLVVVAFSGHGVYLNETSYLCPEETDLGKGEDTLISVDRLYARLKACPAARRVLVVDACRSEPERPGAKDIGTGGGSEAFSKALENPPRGICVMTSCAVKQRSWEDPKLGHGVFMHFLLEGLDGKASDTGDGRVTMMSLFKYASNMTRGYVADKFNEAQTPSFRGELEGGDFDLGVIPNSAVVVAPPKPAAAAGPRVGKEPVRHGGIEIGSKGVKATVIEIVPAPGGGQNIEQRFSKTSNTTIIELKNGRFQEEAIKDTADAVVAFFEQMQTEFKVAPEHIYIVGSSGLLTEDGKPRAANQGDLVKAVKEGTGKMMTFIDVTTEVVMSLKGGVVPAKDRGSSVFIDIGSGNVKCGYYEEETKTSVERFIVAKDLPYGTKTYTDEARKSVNAKDNAQFLAAADAKRDLITDPLSTSIERKPGLVNRQRIYLSGGAVWALASLVHPESAKEKYVRLQGKDIDRFSELLRQTPGSLPTIDLSKVDDPNVRKAAELDIKRVGDTFTWQNLIAAAEILRGLSETLHLKEGKELLFARDGFMSWIVYYVQSSAEAKNRP